VPPFANPVGEGDLVDFTANVNSIDGVIYNTELIGQLPPDIQTNLGSNSARVFGFTSSTAGDGPEGFIDYPITLKATDPVNTNNPPCEYPITLRVNNFGGGGD
jgi:hypothetical protein